MGNERSDIAVVGSVLVEDWLDMGNGSHLNAGIAYVRTGQWPADFVRSLPFGVKLHGGLCTHQIIRNRLLHALLNKFYPNE